MCIKYVQFTLNKHLHVCQYNQSVSLVHFVIDHANSMHSNGMVIEVIAIEYVMTSLLTYVSEFSCNVNVVYCIYAIIVLSNSLMGRQKIAVP